MTRSCRAHPAPGSISPGPVAKGHTMAELNNDKYIAVKVEQIDTELKRLSKQSAALRDRKKAYQAQLSKNSTPTE